MTFSEYLNLIQQCRHRMNVIGRKWKNGFITIDEYDLKMGKMLRLRAYLIIRANRELNN